MNTREAISPRTSDDTIALQLTAEEMQGLAQAAEAAQLPGGHRASPGRPVMHARPQPVPARSARYPRMTSAQWAGVTAMYAGFAVFAWLGASVVATQQRAPVAVASVAHAAAPAPTAPVSVPAAAVQIRNPFDASEVFEFPAGTSDADGRARVADLLLQRARERRSQWANVKRTSGVRIAKS